MKKIIRLTESELIRVVKTIIKESPFGRSYSGDLPKNPLRKLELTLKSEGIDAKLSGINFDFITVKKPGEDLQIIVNEEGRYIIQPRSARDEEDKVLLKTPKSYSGHFEDNLDRGIDYVISFLKRSMDKKRGGFPDEYRPSHRRI
jgi:hypothetical protein